MGGTVERMDIPICQICKDPIWSFICPDCLAKDIDHWLPHSFSKQFAQFHGTLLTFFHPNLDTVFVHCLDCKTESEAAVCPYCYITEVYYWLKQKNVKLARKIYKMLPLGSDWKTTALSGCVWRDGFRPLGEKEAKPAESGVCDECGEYSDELVFIDGEWVCRECGSQ